ncbi:unnamed protein product (macronuclear) [Paramecium tetraurelia]|uniref:Uncharacterized protein n=1 Tax=Paramecium tetraurelia TaxID=5888 RepID=A0BEV1_PARTE|nr:uncharacterized protein GSPATT00028101001 [Paramecium tetraurelia]CAK57068.1 unnamed protein product [Paramecium tetraurelia]|eukprot:XP_001424466.1 hypothetical protein (macronuclear) [Paramecium tetraurelia strain d4-2]
MFSPQIIENLNDYQCSQNHNRPIKSACIQPNYPQNKRFFCEECLKEITIEVHPLGQIRQKIEDDLKTSIQQCEIQISPFLNMLRQLEQNICSLKEYILQEINSLINITSESISKIETLIKKQFSYSFIDTLEKLSKQTPIYFQPQQLIHNIKAFNNTWISQLDERLGKFLQFEQSKKAVEILNNIKHQQSFTNTFVSQQDNLFFYSHNASQEIQKNIKIGQNVFSIKHPYCYAIAINKENNIIVTSSNKNLSIFQIGQGSIKLEQLCENKYSKFIVTLTFFKSATANNTFISGSQDSNIVIWIQNRTIQSQFSWEPKLLLQGHASCINCLIVNSFDSIIISGSDDTKIKFWSPEQSSNKWYCQQTIREHSNSVFGLSINSQGNQLISCGRDMLILVMQNQNNQNWQIKQKIQTQNYGYRLTFINENIFTFQPHLKNKSEIEIFQIDPNTKNYIKLRNLQLQGTKMTCYYYFPQVYIPQLSMLITKNGHYVNFIKFQFTSQHQFQDCKLEAALDFGVLSYGEIFGTTSEDGEYLITWDLLSQCIQIKNSIEVSQTYNDVFRTYSYVSI